MSGARRTAARAAGQTLDATVFLGRAGDVSKAANELAEQLRTRNLVKVRIARAIGGERRGIAHELAKAAGAELIDVRGYTAVFAARRVQKTP